MTDSHNTPPAEEDRGERELLPCPFCGAPAGKTRWTSGASGRAFFRVYCDAPNPPGCALEPFCDEEDEAEAVAAWNRRAPLLSSPRVEECERLRRLVRLADSALSGAPRGKEFFRKAYTEYLTDAALALLFPQGE